MFFLIVVLPGLCLFSLVIGTIYAYREKQADREEHIHNGANQMATERKEEAIEKKKDIIYVSVCCASGLLFLTVCYFAFRNSATAPTEHLDYGSQAIVFVGALTLMLMMVMFCVGVPIAVMMSHDSFMRSCGRFLSCFIICILFIFLAAVLLG